MDKKKVLVVDDHPIVRHGLALLIGQERDLEVCGEASSHDEALEVLAKTKPDVVLVDISLKDSNGIELIKSIRAKDEAIPLIVLSMHDETLYAERALRAGANGYVMKQQADMTVLDAIRQVLAGELYVSDRISAQLVKQYIGGPRKDPSSSGVERLSDRELEVFTWVGKGMSTQEIAEKLDLSVKTVEAHKAHIKKKMNIDSATQLVHQAVRWVERHDIAP